jgi:hypothetical protein
LIVYSPVRNIDSWRWTYFRLFDSIDVAIGVATELGSGDEYCRIGGRGNALEKARGYVYFAVVGEEDVGFVEEGVVGCAFGREEKAMR